MLEHQQSDHFVLSKLWQKANNNGSPIKCRTGGKKSLRSLSIFKSFLLSLDTLFQFFLSSDTRKLMAIKQFCLAQQMLNHHQLIWIAMYCYGSFYPKG